MSQIKTNHDNLSVVVQGGLGNQMFQYAFFKALEKTHKYVLLDLSLFNHTNVENRPFMLDKAFNIYLDPKRLRFDFLKIARPNLMIRIINRILRKLSCYQVINKKIEDLVITENDYIYPERYFKITKGFLSGYWQSEEYFSNIMDEIDTFFTFNIIEDVTVKKIEHDITKTKDSVALHWRRGDYIGHKSLGLDLTKYMYNSLEYISNAKSITDIFVFTEDIDWVNNRLSEFRFNLKYHFVSSELYYKPDYYEMYLMSKAKHNIISNSSFSWWGAYLNDNPNKVVIAPSKWTNENFNIRFTNIIPKEWIKIDLS